MRLRAAVKPQYKVILAYNYAKVNNCLTVRKLL